MELTLSELIELAQTKGEKWLLGAAKTQLEREYKRAGAKELAARRKKATQLINEMNSIELDLLKNQALTSSQQ